MKGIIHSKVRGVTFEGRQDLIRKSVRPGMKLQAIREPNNPHGKNAIGLWAGNAQIGYLASDLSDELAPQMDAGKPIGVTVTEMTGSGPGEAIGVNIVIDTQGGSSIAVPTQSPVWRLALILAGLLLVTLVCAAALLWQWRRAGGRWIR